jgi:hypothetical protein
MDANHSPPYFCVLINSVLNAVLHSAIDSVLYFFASTPHIPHVFPSHPRAVQCSRP